MGDYKNLQNCHPILGEDYYINSINFILSKKRSTIKWTILYFCEEEDMDEVQSKVEKIKKECMEYFCEKGQEYELEFERAGGECKIEDWRQLLLMSCCQHNIIANSSFSWWAAYFNDNSEKIICYPETWFGSQLSNHNTSDMCPKSWNKIKNI
jgi:hypothetical protein